MKSMTKSDFITIMVQDAMSEKSSVDQIVRSYLSTNFGN
jgi:hypothetical protein